MSRSVLHLSAVDSQLRHKSSISIRLAVKELSFVTFSVGVLDKTFALKFTVVPSTNVELEFVTGWVNLFALAVLDPRILELNHISGVLFNVIAFLTKFVVIFVMNRKIFKWTTILLTFLHLSSFRNHIYI